MAFDPFAEPAAKPAPAAHAIGGDLSALSLHELDERVALLEGEIARLKQARAAKEASREAASAVFKPAARPEARDG